MSRSKLSYGGEKGRFGTIDFQNRLYHRPLKTAVGKYFGVLTHPCLYSNTPKVQFLMLYQKIGDDILDILDSTAFSQFDTVQQIPKVGKKACTLKFKKGRARRLIRAFRSIKKYGYCSGKFTRYDAIHVKKGFYSKKYDDDPSGFIVLRRHHRAATCVALGIKEALCIVYNEPMVNHYKY